jgi:transcription-repair coupling factor (superfamily II helicase)
MIDPNIPKSWVKLPYIISSIIPKKSKKMTVYRKIIKLITSRWLAGISGVFFTYVRYSKNQAFLIILNNNKEEAAYYWNDLEQMIGDKDVCFYQALIVVHIKLKIRIMPMFCFVPKCSTESIPQETGYNCYLSEALFEKVVTRRDLEKNT